MAHLPLAVILVIAIKIRLIVLLIAGWLASWICAAHACYSPTFTTSQDDGGDVP